MNIRSIIRIFHLLILLFSIIFSPIHSPITNTTFNWIIHPREFKIPIFAIKQNSSLDLIPPIITGPSDISYLVNTTGHNITWYIADKNPKNYSIQHNYQYIETEWNKTWTENQSVTVSIDGLPIGIHLYTIIAEDTWNNRLSDDVIVSVKETANVPSFPISTLSPFDLADYVNLFFLFGISMILLLIVLSIIRNRKKEEIPIKLPPEDPLELEVIKEENFI
ncbi:hypothetical protein [Candidatus Hodarchaeum mangrovi]